MCCCLLHIKFLVNEDYQEFEEICIENPEQELHGGISNVKPDTKGYVRGNNIKNYHLKIRKCFCISKI